MMKIAVALAFIAVCTALPSSTQEVVPETEFVTAYDEAKAEVASLQRAGKDDGACANLAAATIKEVSDAVSAAQAGLDALDTGADCHQKGQPAIDAAQKALDDGNQAVEDAEKTHADALATPIDFGTHAFGGLKRGECDVFFENAQFLAAEGTEKAAADALAKAKGAIKGFEDNLQTAKDEAKSERAACRCKAKEAYNKAWKAANENNDSNEKAFTKGKHMECVLAGTPPADCQVGDVPKVTPIELPADVKAQECSRSGTALIINGQSNAFLYNSAHWASTETVDDGQNKKTELYNEPGVECEVKAFANGATRTVGTFPMGGKSLRELFTGGKHAVNLPVNNWRQSVNGASWQANCNKQGFNMNYNYVGNMRFGMSYNNENNCKSNDIGTGVGFDRISAGTRYGCCRANHGGAQHDVKAIFYFTIKGTKYT